MFVTSGGKPASLVMALAIDEEEATLEHESSSGFEGQKLNGFHEKFRSTDVYHFSFS